jgi:hypothetical protein
MASHGRIMEETNSPAMKNNQRNDDKLYYNAFALSGTMRQHNGLLIGIWEFHLNIIILSRAF